MNRVVGGELPAAIWRRFMVEAHKGLPVRDFREVAPLPEGGGDAVIAARADFYATLSAEFEREAGEPDPAADPEAELAEAVQPPESF